MTMKPITLEILLYYYSRNKDYANGSFSSAARESIEFLLEHSLLSKIEEGKHTWQGGTPIYSVTPRGRAYVRGLLQIPFPAYRWVMPAISEIDVSSDAQKAIGGFKLFDPRIPSVEE